MAADVPAAHAEHAAELTRANVPAAQLEHLDAVSREYAPAAQFEQPVAPVAAA